MSEVVFELNQKLLVLLGKKENMNFVTNLLELLLHHQLELLKTKYWVNGNENLSLSLQRPSLAEQMLVASLASYIFDEMPILNLVSMLHGLKFNMPMQ